MTCSYCGEAAPASRALCLDCWSDIPDEIRDRVDTTARQKGLASPQFECAVEGAVKFLMWKDDVC